MNYQESLDYLQSLVPTLERPGLERMREYFKSENNPQNRLPVVHVGGTNGKGSVTTFVASALSALGYRTGKFTGPHLHKFNERFVIDGQIINDEQFADVATTLLQQPQAKTLTWFEFLTAMAVQYFNREELTASVFEVGLGGRFDATSTIDNVAVSVITNVDLDHVHLLGDTVEKIAFEKAGIIKADIPVITACTGGALEVLVKRAQELRAPLIVLDGGAAQRKNIFKDYSVSIIDEGYKLSDNCRNSLQALKSFLADREVVLGLGGAYQRGNALLACLAACLYTCIRQGNVLNQTDLEKILDGLAKASWPGRFQFVEDPPMLLDGAHNSHGTRALRKSLEELYPGKNFVFVFACFENKDMKSLLGELVKEGDILLAPALSHSRAVRSKEEISNFARQSGMHSQVFDNLQDALREGLAIINTHTSDKPKRYADHLIVCGSFALIKEAQLLAKKG